MVSKKATAIAMCMAWDIFFDSDSEFENEEVHTINFSMNGFAEKIVPRMCSEQFKIHFRLSSETFQDLCRFVASCDNGDFKKTRPEISLEKQLLVTVWYLANAESFRTIGNRFNLDRSSCYRIVFRTCQRLLEVNCRQKIINFPCQTEREKTETYFKNLSNIPGVISAIDGCHIKIVAPKEYSSSYINRKGFSSVLLQGICNEERKFIDCYVGEAGSIHDATLLKRSPIFRKFNNGAIQIPNSMHFVGDNAYPLLDYIMVPHKDNGNLTTKQKKFNHCLSKCRVRIEQTFGILKMRFRKLKLIENRRMDFMIIMSCCILHNLCNKNNDNIELTDNECITIINDVFNEIRSSNGSAKRIMLTNLM